jgi:hypothetical protein
VTPPRRSRAPFGRLRPLWVAALALGCAVTPAAREPLHEPDRLALPSDLGAVVRVDAAALGAELGAELTQKVLRDAAGADVVGADPLLARSLGAANVLWIGLPGLEASEATPAVLLLRGHFSSIAGSTEPAGVWSTRGGSDLRVLDRTAAPGSGFARVYALPGDEVLVWASATEVIPVERALLGDAGGAPLHAPERGAVSMAARPEDVLARSRARYPELSERFAGLTRFEAFAEATQGTWRAELTLEFAALGQASGANEVLEKLKQALAERSCAVGALARGLFVSRFERSLRVQAWLEGPALEAVRGCVLGATCCA